MSLEHAGPFADHVQHRVPEGSEVYPEPAAKHFGRFHFLDLEIEALVKVDLLAELLHFRR